VQLIARWSQAEMPRWVTPLAGMWVEVVFWDWRSNGSCEAEHAAGAQVSPRELMIMPRLSHFDGSFGAWHAAIEVG
jgi:hypothetical protein